MGNICARSRPSCLSGWPNSYVSFERRCERTNTSLLSIVAGSQQNSVQLPGTWPQHLYHGIVLITSRALIDVNAAVHYEINPFRNHVTGPCHDCLWTERDCNVVPNSHAGVSSTSIGLQHLFAIVLQFLNFCFEVFLSTGLGERIRVISHDWVIFVTHSRIYSRR